MIDINKTNRNNFDLIQNLTEMIKYEIMEEVKELIHLEIKETLNKYRQTNKYDKYMTTQEVMEYLDVSRVTIFNWVNRGILKKLIIADQPRFLKSDIDKAFVEYIPLRSA